MKSNTPLTSPMSNDSANYILSLSICGKAFKVGVASGNDDYPTVLIDTDSVLTAFDCTTDELSAGLPRYFKGSKYMTTREFDAVVRYLSEVEENDDVWDFIYNCFASNDTFYEPGDVIARGYLSEYDKVKAEADIVLAKFDGAKTDAEIDALCTELELLGVGFDKLYIG